MSMDNGGSILARLLRNEHDIERTQDEVGKMRDAVADLKSDMRVLGADVKGELRTMRSGLKDQATLQAERDKKTDRNNARLNVLIAVLGSGAIALFLNLANHAVG